MNPQVFRDQTDEALVAAILSGQAEAWQTLVDRYNRRAVAVARNRLGGDLDLAGEVVQTVWEQVVRFLAGGGQVDHFARFFHSVLSRRCVDAIRRRSRQPGTVSLQAPLGPDPEGGNLEDVLPDPDEGALAELLRAEEQEAVRAALDRLSPRDQAVLLARAGGELGNRETARLLVEQGLVEPGGNAEKRVENYFYRALVRLERELEKERSPHAG